MLLIVLFSLLALWVLFLNLYFFLVVLKEEKVQEATPIPLPMWLRQLKVCIINPIIEAIRAVEYDWHDPPKWAQMSFKHQPVRGAPAPRTLPFVCFCKYSDLWYARARMHLSCFITLLALFCVNTDVDTRWTQILRFVPPRTRLWRIETMPDPSEYPESWEFRPFELFVRKRTIEEILSRATLELKRPVEPLWSEAFARTFQLRKQINMNRRPFHKYRY